MSETTGDIWVQGTFDSGTGGAPGTAVFATPTRLTALGSGWKKATLADYGDFCMLLHTDGTVKVCGNGTFAYIGADTKLYAHYLDYTAPQLISPLTGWLGILNSDDVGSGDVYAVRRGAGETTVAYKLDNIPAEGSETDINLTGDSYEFPIYAVAGSAVPYYPSIMLISGSEPPTGPTPPSFFRTVLVNTSEMP